MTVPRNTTKSKSRAESRPSVKLQQRLALNRFICSLLGFEKFEDIAAFMRTTEEGLTADNVHRFYYSLIANLPQLAPINADQLMIYDQNIVRHTQRIQARRDHPIVWKYFQYLTLLFTEIYLDRYFSNAERLVSDLNNFLTGENQPGVFAWDTEGCGWNEAPWAKPGFNENLPEEDKIAPFVADDLRKLAFWNATGSGKTLLMHINILQYRHYAEKHNRSAELNRIILLTPNEGLSQQHLQEFRKSGMEAEIFVKDGGTLFQGKKIEIIEISKLRDEGKEKTVAVDAFEDNNLVLIDEGHRGTGGDTWRDMRKRLAADGFAFEYSATFGQAISAASASKKRELAMEYAKAIIFDYSYKYFYGDGHGKDYRILNLADDSDDETRQLYMTACLLTYLQQLLVYKGRNRELREFNIEKPLWIFVGGKVTAVRTVNSRQVSDVVDILLFLSDFVHNKKDSIRLLERMSKGKPGLLDKSGNEIFSQAFHFISDHMKTPELLYKEILENIFNASSEAALHIDELKGTDGEIALRLGENEPFGVVNVGDAPALIKLCEQNGLITSEKNFSGSLFRSIDAADSNINILIGSKKFSEGWSSWRVSTMGLMNIGRSEGSEIIQLFGRGVRLKGRNFCLKRHGYIPGVQRNNYLACLETLNVFGIRADYMKQFQEYLADEGLPGEEERLEIVIPTIKNLGTQRIKTIKLKEGLDYKRNAPKPHLDTPPKGFLPKYRITLDWYTRLQMDASDGVKEGSHLAELHTGQLEAKHLAFLDFDRLYFEVQNFKAEKGWFNLCLHQEAIRQLFETPDWYTLYIDQSELEIRSFECYTRWQEIASALLRKYCEKLYKWYQANWEKDFLEYRELSKDDPNFIEEYRIMLDKSQADIADKLLELKNQIGKGVLKDFEYGSIQAIMFDRHLYQPLLHVAGVSIEVSPVPLNDGEKQFICDLRNHHQQKAAWFHDKEMYVLRNMPRGRGVGFFEAGNFYPDFIMWLLDKGRQQITFIDPKGIRNLEGDNDPKIAFYQSIKDIEKRLNASDVSLHSFIISTTPWERVNWKGKLTKDDLKSHHVLFQDDNDYIDSLFRNI